MVTVIHVVGLQGVGKSTVAESMAARDEARGLRTGHTLEGDRISRAKALAMFPEADVVYLEALRSEDVDALPGELVITLERVPATLAGEGL